MVEIINITGTGKVNYTDKQVPVKGEEQNEGVYTYQLSSKPRGLTTHENENQYTLEWKVRINRNQPRFEIEMTPTTPHEYVQLVSIKRRLLSQFDKRLTKRTVLSYLYRDALNKVQATFMGVTTSDWGLSIFQIDTRSGLRLLKTSFNNYKPKSWAYNQEYPPIETVWDNNYKPAYNEFLIKNSITAVYDKTLKTQYTNEDDNSTSTLLVKNNTASINLNREAKPDQNNYPTIYPRGLIVPLGQYDVEMIYPATTRFGRGENTQGILRLYYTYFKKIKVTPTETVGKCVEITMQLCDHKAEPIPNARVVTKLNDTDAVTTLTDEQGYVSRSYVDNGAGHTTKYSFIYGGNIVNDDAGTNIEYTVTRERLKPRISIPDIEGTVDTTGLSFNATVEYPTWTYTNYSSGHLQEGQPNPSTEKEVWKPLGIQMWLYDTEYTGSQTPEEAHLITELKSNSSGVASLEYLFNKTYNNTWTCKSKATNRYQQVLQTFHVKITNKKQVNITVMPCGSSSKPNSIYRYTSPLYATITDSETGKALSNRQVRFSHKGTIIGTVTTDSQGIAEIDYQHLEVGEIHFTVEHLSKQTMYDYKKEILKVYIGKDTPFLSVGLDARVNGESLDVWNVDGDNNIVNPMTTTPITVLYGQYLILDIQLLHSGYLPSMSASKKYYYSNNYVLVNPIYSNGSEAGLNAYTDKTGEATFEMGVEIVDYNLTKIRITTDDNRYYNPLTFTIPVTMQGRDTKLDTSEMNNSFNPYVKQSLPVYLYDEDSKPVSDAKIKAVITDTDDNTLSGSQYSTSTTFTTDNNGKITLTPTFTSVEAGKTLKLKLTYDGINGKYNTCSTTKLLYVWKIPTSIDQDDLFANKVPEGKVTIKPFLYYNNSSGVKQAISNKTLKLYEITTDSTTKKSTTTLLTSITTNNKGVATLERAYTDGIHKLKLVFNEDNTDGLYKQSSVIFELQVKAKVVINPCDNYDDFKCYIEPWYASSENCRSANRPNTTMITTDPYKGKCFYTICKPLAKQGYGDDEGIHAPCGVVLHLPSLKTYSNHYKITYKIKIVPNGDNRWGCHYGLASEQSSESSKYKSVEGKQSPIRLEQFKVNSVGNNYVIVYGSLNPNASFKKLQPNIWYEISFEVQEGSVIYIAKGTNFYDKVTLNNTLDKKDFQNLYPYFMNFMGSGKGSDSSASEVIVREIKLERFEIPDDI